MSPRLFARAFELSNRGKNLRGDYDEWDRQELIVQDEAFGDAIPDWEAAAGAYLSERLQATAPKKSPRPRKGTRTATASPGSSKNDAEGAPKKRNRRA